jgi:hypothetical protein
LFVAIAVGLALLVALAIGTFTRRASLTALLVMGVFAGVATLLAGGGSALLVWGPAMGLVAGLVAESIRDTARALRPFDEAPAAERRHARRAVTRRAA